MPARRVIALTGGLCAGKSRVADWLREIGWPVLDADRAAREVVAPDSEGLKRVVDTFGQAVLTADGQLDRPHLRQIVFNDPAAREQLEALLHPLIHARLRDELTHLDTPLAFVELPLLTESGRPDYVDEVWLVECDEATRLRRCVETRGLDEATCHAIMAAQAAPEARRAVADHIIDNSGDWPSTVQQLQALLHQAEMAATP